MYFCAWCKDLMDRTSGPLDGKPAVKHGMCRSCLDAKLAELGYREYAAQPSRVRPEPAQEHRAAA
jgi:hypothetical protein